MTTQTRWEPNPFLKLMTGIVLVALLVGSGSSAFAQADANKGQIAGTVFDQKQGAIPNAKVHLENTNTGVVRELTTGPEGQFRAVLLDPGQYNVTVEAPGFAPAEFKGVVLSVGSAMNLPVTLTVGTTTQTIEVSATQLAVDLPAPTTIINTAAIESLPINGRRFTDFAALTPTVQIDQTRGSISFAGQRGINGNIMVDGTDYNNPFFGGTRGGERSGFVFTVPQTSIEEFQAVTTGYAAEYGRSTGGVLNAITKSGGNAVHGEAFYQIRHKETGLQTPFKTQNLETLQQFGGGAGGSIIKDKLFWFAAAERQISRLPRSVFFSTLAGVAPTTQTAEALSFYHTLEQGFKSTNDAVATTGRMDYAMSDGSRITARLNFSDANADNAITTGAPLPTLDTRALSGTGAEKDRTYTGIAQWTKILSPSMANDLRFSGTHEDRPRSSNSLAANVSTTIGNFGARNFLPTVQDDTRYQINDGFTISHAAHTMKFGGDYNYLTTFQRFGFNQFGSFSFSTTSIPTLLKILTVAPGQNRFDDPAAQYRLEIGNLLADYHMHQIAFFAQDNWRINSQFQINYGVRWEGQVNPEAVASNSSVVKAIQAARFPVNATFDPAQLQSNLNQWMPRFGFTLTPVKGSTRTVIRGHAGLFYAATPMLVYGGTTNNFRQPPGDVSLFIAGGTGAPTVYQVFKTAGIDVNTFKLDTLPTPPVDKIIGAIGSLTGATPDPFLQASFTGTANDFQNPRAFQAGVGADHQIRSNWTVSAQFNYVNTVHLERNRDYNLPFPSIRAADGRAIFIRNNRPLPQYGQITIRESSARSLYRGTTLSTRYTTSRVQFGLQYTVAQAYSDDDNERTATGFTYDNPFNLKAEYGYSNLDIRHNFSTYAVTNLPWGIQLAPIFRINSGQPIDALAGADVNADGSGSNNDRAFKGVGVPYERNAFRNRSFKVVDLRFLKNFQLNEKMKLQFSTEMFNLFNFANVVIGPAGINNVNTIYGLGIDATGATVAARDTFMRLKLADGSYDKSNNQLGTPFQAQFGLRFIF